MNPTNNMHTDSPLGPLRDMPVGEMKRAMDSAINAFTADKKQRVSAGGAVAGGAVAGGAVAGGAVAGGDAEVGVPDEAVDKEREAALKKRRERAEAAAAAAEKRLKTETTVDAESADGATCGGVEPSEPAGGDKPAIVLETEGVIDLTMDSPSAPCCTATTDANGNVVFVPLYDDEDYHAFSHPSGPPAEFPISPSIGFCGVDGHIVITDNTPPQTITSPIVVDNDEEVSSVATEEQKAEVVVPASPVVSVATEEQKEQVDVAGSASPVVSVATEEQKEQVEVAGSASPVVSVATEEQKEQVDVAGSASPVGSPDLFADPNATAGGSPVHLTPLSATPSSAATTQSETAPLEFVGPAGEGILKFKGFGYDKKE